MLNHKFKKLLLASSILVAAGAANAGYNLDISDNDKITFGGFIEATARTIDGDVTSPTDYWYGGSSVGTDVQTTDFSVNSTRFNAKYVHGDVTGFIEMDFFGGGGTETISNSSHPRLRHAFIKYKNILVGQTWSTFQNTSALAESVSFGGPLNSGVFVRQTQVRYTNGGLQLSLENSHISGTGADNNQNSIPDFVAKYTFKGDWGNVSVAGLARQLTTNVGGIEDEETAIGYGVAGRIKTFGKDDLRFQINAGETGRYVGTSVVSDVVNGEVQESTSFMVAYRHFWSDDVRSSVYYGSTDADIQDNKHNHMAINLFKNYTKQLSFGIEVGQYEIETDTGDGESNYLEFTAKYVL